MDEHILRKDAIDAALAGADRWDGGSNTNRDLFITKEMNNVPAADVKPVVHGRWTLNHDGSGTCSECGRTSKYVWDMDNWANFCQHCGADMRGGIIETEG